jgi:hypothetical protein
MRWRTQRPTPNPLFLDGNELARVAEGRSPGPSKGISSIAARQAPTSARTPTRPERPTWARAGRRLRRPKQPGPSPHSCAGTRLAGRLGSTRNRRAPGPPRPGPARARSACLWTNLRRELRSGSSLSGASRSGRSLNASPETPPRKSRLLHSSKSNNREFRPRPASRLHGVPLRRRHRCCSRRSSRWARSQPRARAATMPGSRPCAGEAGRDSRN